MKTRIYTIAIMATAAFFVGCGETSTKSAEEEAPVEMMSIEEMETPTKLAVKIEGMSCPSGCAAPIQENCSKLAGVGESKVNFADGMGYFTFDASIMSQDDILKCISGTNGGGIYTGTVVEDDAEVESDEATTEEAIHTEKNEDEVSV